MRIQTSIETKAYRDGRDQSKVVVFAQVQRTDGTRETIILDLKPRQARPLFEEGLRVCEVIEAEERINRAGAVAGQLDLCSDDILRALHATGLELVEKEPAP